MPELAHDGDIFVLDIGDAENRFHPDWVADMSVLLDEVEHTDGPRALVITARGKFFSNGLDLEWLSQHGADLLGYLASVEHLLARLLSLPVPTVAAVQGHAFAAGGMLTLAHDFRVMRADRGFFCLPEVDIGIPFSPGMAGLIQSRLSKQTAHEAMTTGRRYGGGDALAAGIVDAVAHADDVLSTALELAEPLTAKAGPTLGTIKERMYPEVLRALRNPQLSVDPTAPLG
jgi:enoyl-CoA hydratase/carnithine racemase